MENKYDIAIVYRIYPKISKVPPIFDDDKYNLSELCLKSFSAALTNINAKIWVILDNCPEEYELLFKTHLKNFDYELIKTDVKSNQKTFGLQLDKLCSQNESDIVYFAEDDYFYMSNAFSKMLEQIKKADVDFISPFDHLDYYTLDLHNFKSDEIVNNGIRWKVRGSTTMTFMTTKKILLETKKIFLTYTNKNDDASLWFALSKKRMTNPIKLLTYLFTYMPGVKFMIKSWLHTPYQITFGKKYKLWIPSKSLALHMDNMTMAPNVDWENEFKVFL